jgi:hypothetical protein
MVSHLFLLASRKHLFFSIHLDYPPKPQKLHNLLTTRPGISAFIRELYVKDFCEDVWCATNEYLPLPLTAVLHLELLSLAAPESNPLTTWYNLSRDLKSAIEERLRSPILTDRNYRAARLHYSSFYPLAENHVKQCRFS